MKRFLLVSFLMIFIIRAANAQIAAWDFTGVGSTLLSTYAATTFNGNLVTTSGANQITRGATAPWSTAGNSFRTTGFQNNGIATTNTDYFQITIGAVTGYKVSLSTIDARFAGTASFAASPGVSSQFAYSLDGTNFTLIGSPAVTVGTPATLPQIDLTGVAALQNVLSGTTITLRYYASGQTTTGGWGFNSPSAGTNGLAIGGTVAPISSNTISITVIGAPFNLANCADVAGGTVNFTSTGTFNLGNIYTAQLSDATGSFGSPVYIGSISSTSSSGTIPISIIAPQVTSSLYRIRVISSDPIAVSPSSAAFTINQSGTCTSNATDYFRSVASGSWNSLSTWQSSNDSSSWIAATLIPGASAAHVVVTNSDSVYLAGGTTTQNLTINSSAIVNALTFTMTASARFNLLNTASFYQGGTINPVPGVEQVLSTTSNYHYNGTQAGISAALPEFGNLFWEPTPSGNNTFQNTTAAAPFNNGLVVRGNMTINIQGATAREIRFATGTTVSRTHTIDGNLNIISSNSIVVVQNGGVASSTSGTVNIGGNLNISAGTFQGLSSSTLNTGIALVNLGGNLNNTGGIMQAPALGLGTYTFNFTGTGNVNANAGAGNSFYDVSIAANKTVSLTVNNFSIISGKNLVLAGANSYMALGSNNLIVDGIILGGASNAYIRTNGGNGFLTLNTIGGTSKNFPLGETTYNPLIISNGSGNRDFSARVRTGIFDPNGAIPTDAVNRTWYIQASTTTIDATVTYQYSNNPGELTGTAASQPTNMELLLSDYTTWSLSPGNTTIFPAGGPPYTVTTATPIFINNSPVPYALGVTGTKFLAIDCIITTRAQKRNNTGIISWNINSCADVTSFEVQRLVNNGFYQTIGTVTPSINQTDFSFTDPSLVKGTNLYRVKVNRLAGSIKYSNTVALIYESDAVLITSVVPNPLHSSAILTLSAAKQGSADFKLYNMSGLLVKQWHSKFAEGNNIIQMNAYDLPAGIYQVLVSTAYSKTVTRFVKQ